MSEPVNVPQAAPAPSTAPAPAPSKSTTVTRTVVIALVVLLLIVALFFYLSNLFTVTTDDAYVEADTITVVPKVPAYVAALHVNDNTAFTKGELLVELDPRDYQVAVNNALADLVSAKAFKVNLAAQIDEQRHQVAAAQASLDGDQVTLTFANQQFVRYTALSQSGSDTKERLQLANSEVGQRRSAVERDTATLSAAKAHVTVLESQVTQAEAAIAAKQAALDQAKLNLSYTRIYATMSGTVANRSVQVGNYVQPGQALFSAVPDEVFIVANIKETRLGEVRAGQSVAVRVDALPERDLHGHVDSVQRGTGSTFALLPPENATGNFVKVVQRVPVKILLDDPPEKLKSLSPGMSVVVKITVRTHLFGQDNPQH